jgi:hypothetical protein
MRLGADPKGLVGAGFTTRVPFEAEHWSQASREAGKPAIYIEVRLEHLAALPVVRASELVSGALSRVRWFPEASGLELPADVAADLESLWARVPQPPARAWLLRPGDQIKRTELHSLYGGRRQGGISPSRVTDNVMLFSDPAVGQKYGYSDGWHDDGFFHYSGEGQEGDQSLDQGNGSILRHRKEGRAIRLFEGTSDWVTYLGEFVLDEERPYFRRDAAEFGSDRVREVVVFRLRRVDGVVPHEIAAHRASSVSSVLEVPVESRETERALIIPHGQPFEAERRESDLVHRYRQFMADRGEPLIRHRIRAPGEATDMLTDLFNPRRNQLIEAKGTVTRDAVRTAIGQLADYARFFSPQPACALLLPQRPRPDLEALLRIQRIALVWPIGSSFEDNAEGAFVAGRRQPASVLNIRAVVAE